MRHPAKLLQSHQTTRLLRARAKSPNSVFIIFLRILFKIHEHFPNFQGHGWINSQAFQVFKEFNDAGNSVILLKLGIEPLLVAAQGFNQIKLKLEEVDINDVGTTLHKR